MSMFDSFLMSVDCPKCRQLSRDVEFQTKALGCSLKTFKEGDILADKDLEIVYGYINNVYGECPNCHVHLKGEVRIVEGRVFGLESVRVWEIQA